MFLYSSLLDKGKIYCDHGNANFSRVKISSIWGKAHLIRGGRTGE